MKQALVLLTTLTTLSAADPLAGWNTDIKPKAVVPDAAHHSIHSYYVNNPESPDGKRVLYFASPHLNGHLGEVRMRDRATGEETVLATDVHTEDAHRAACQQWLSGGRLVAFHEVVEKKWRVVVVDVQTLEKKVVAEDRQVGFGQPSGTLLPMYGCHWNPGPYRDLYVWDAATGKTEVKATIAEVEAQYGDWLKAKFQDKQRSIFFPVLSPDLQRVFFKMSAGNGGDNFMSSGASSREGIVCYDFASQKCIWQREKWGHPAWMPDSWRIFEVGNIIFDVREPSEKMGRVPDLVKPRGSHPSVSPDGTLMVTDGMSEDLGGKKGEWGIWICDLRGGRSVLLHSFDQTQGARSWRRNHPHPVFSADGQRIYYNVSDGPWVRLFVLERGKVE
jgi:hypothetical protein